LLAILQIRMQIDWILLQRTLAARTHRRIHHGEFIVHLLTWISEAAKNPSACIDNCLSVVLLWQSRPSVHILIFSTTDRNIRTSWIFHPSLKLELHLETWWSPWMQHFTHKTIVSRHPSYLTSEILIL